MSLAEFLDMANPGVTQIETYRHHFNLFLQQASTQLFEKLKMKGG